MKLGAGILGGLFIVWQVVGILVLAVVQLCVTLEQDLVWSQIRDGSQKLAVLEAPLVNAFSDRPDYSEEINSGILVMGLTPSMKDAMLAAENTQKVLVEMRDSQNLSEEIAAQLDQMITAFGRITDNKQAVMESQMGYNSLRTMFAPAGLFFPAQDVVK